jgi:hypothetical protein
MFKKIQNYGLPKNVFEKQVRFVALEGLNNSENKLNRFSSLLDGFKEVSLYGWDSALKKGYSKATIQILKSFNLEKIDDVSFNRNLKDNQKIERVLSSFDSLHNFFREMTDVETEEEETEYQNILLAFLLFLETYYSENYLIEIEKIENLVKEKVTEINGSDIENKNQEFEKFLNNLEKESIETFEGLAEELETETINFVDDAIKVFGTTLTVQVIEDSKGFWFKEYLSNVIGNLGLFFRQTKESFSQDLRSFENKVKKISINKNNIKLSVISEYKALFRNLIYESTKAHYYKTVLPYSLLKDLNPNGQTQAILFQIKTVEEWNDYAKTTNVVNGFGIHHNSQEFYYPIKKEDLEKEKETAKNQRKEFLNLIK